MTRCQHLLLILGEECSEVAQRASKALRFGIEEREPGQAPNHQRLREELADVWALMEMIEAETGLSLHPLAVQVKAKTSKVEYFLRYSTQCGTLKP